MHFVKVFLGPSGWGVTFTNYMLYMLVWGSSMPFVMCVCVPNLELLLQDQGK